MTGIKAKIKITFAVFVVIWLVAATQIAVTNLFSEKAHFTEAFSTREDVVITGESLDVVAKIDDASKLVDGAEDIDGAKKSDMDNYTAVTRDIMNKLCSPGFCIYDNSANLYEPGKCIKANGSSDNYNVGMTLSSFDGTKEAYAHIKIDSTMNSAKTAKEKKSTNNIYSHKNTIEKEFDKLGATYISYTKINGYVESICSDSECLKIADEIFDRLSAQKKSVHTGDVCTVYGYSDNLPESIISDDGEKINVQISFSCNEQKNITEICVATPINNESY